jgi:hypothetical protein
VSTVLDENVGRGKHELTSSATFHAQIAPEERPELVAVSKVHRPVTQRLQDLEYKSKN